MIPRRKCKVPFCLHRKDSGRPEAEASICQCPDHLRPIPEIPVQYRRQALYQAPPFRCSSAPSGSFRSQIMFSAAGCPFGHSQQPFFSSKSAAPPQSCSILCRPDTVPSIWKIQTRSSDRKIWSLLLAFIISQPLPERGLPHRSLRSAPACRPSVSPSCLHSYR